MGFVWLGVSAVAFFVLYLMYKGTQAQKQDQTWMEDKIKQMNIPNSFIIGNSLVKEVLVYSSNNYIYIFNKINKLVKQINKEDILGVELDIYTTEKNVKRLIALTSTFDKHTRVSSVVFRLITRDSTHEFDCYYEGKNAMGEYISNVYDMINDLKRYKLLLDEDIKQFNNANI